MKGSEAQLLSFMEGTNNRYVIPVYQRKYDWKIDNCRQLYGDLKRIIIDGKNSHFFGSIVSQVVPDGSKIEFHIIDGQQRLTTVTLLLLAIANLVRTGKVKSEEQDLDDQILECFIIAKWAKKDDQIKLRPVKSDRSALEKLVAGDPYYYEPASNLTINYRFFCDQILKEEISVDELFKAIGKLQIISITLETDDNAQLIFESLNSTGLALTEGDKIRNYILMGLSPKEQDEYYDKYWTKIESACIGNDVSSFVRDYLSIKQLVTPTISNVYQAFKKYVESEQIPLQTLLEDMMKYAKIYNKLLTGKSGLGNLELDACMYRLNRLEITVTEPFFMEILRLNQDGGKLSVDDLTKIFQITENYLFRRNICDVPTNALNKIFLNLNREVIHYDNTTNNYVNKFIYALRSKKESARFPDDEEFSQALENKAVYQMRGRYKSYLFERFENFGTLEMKDVYTLLDDGTYSIEHIMPQHLNAAWMRELGSDAETVHSTWLHRLGNLTLTAYNSNMSNASFQDKRDAEHGYAKSGLRMNQQIAKKDHWGPDEMQERSDEMVDKATKRIWPMPSTTFVPVEKEFDSCTLDDEDVDLKGRDIVKYSYQNVETPVTSWSDMFEHMVKFLHSEDKSVLSTLVYNSDDNMDLQSYFSSTPDLLKQPLKIDEDIYTEKNTSTALRISILRRLFILFKADPMDLVFYLRDVQQEKVSDESRYELRKKYWAFALPEIQKKNAHRGTFTNCALTSSNTVSGYFGLSGFSIHCVANYDKARVDMYLGNGSKEKNKKAFDLLQNHKSEIESNLGTALNWERSNDTKGSWISYSLKDVSITNEADWTRMAKFQAEWSDKFGNEMIPILEENFRDENEEERNKKKRIAEVAGYIHEWGLKKTESGKIDFDLAKSNRAYSRFRTKEMSALLPDVDDKLSDWNVLNHYFYEIRNTTGDSLYIQLAFNSKHLPEGQRKICEHICDLESKKYKENWDYVLPIRTDTETFGTNTGKEDVFRSLDKLLEEILEKQNGLLKRLEESR